ncbi:MAG: large conductance mechanosensitive channel protein MscL [Flavobacteriaceae bacterium]|nr:large conductance mechanosensitive channel protein MscL [Flavobacteriaceae bacterium]
MLREFRDFIMTGNVIDLAVAVILAGAVGLVVNGFVNDIMMPIVGHFAGGVDFADMKYVLTPGIGVEGADGYVPENAIRYGAWINSIISLVTVGFVLFMIVKAYNKVRTPVEEAPAGPTQEELLTEIRDLLAKK